MPGSRRKQPSKVVSKKRACRAKKYNFHSKKQKSNSENKEAEVKNQSDIKQEQNPEKIGVPDSAVKQLMEKNLTAIPAKHRFYNQVAQEFFKSGNVVGVSGFVGVYPTSKRLLDEKIYAMMLDWF